KLRRAASDEQARIARELHDVIAHNVSVMVVQAAAASDVFDSRPELAREALRSIEDTGRAALTELRRLLGVVQAPNADTYAPQPRGRAGARTGHPRAPPAGRGPMEGRGARAGPAGLPVALNVEGALNALPTGLDLSAYRIVQEALPNPLKHARASPADVDVRR